jgi:hypothetical protein
MGHKRNTYGIFVGNPKGKSPLARPRHGWWIILKWLFERRWGGMYSNLVVIDTTGGLY